MLKRFIDVLISIAVLVILSPLFLALAALVRLSSPGPVFYKADRVGWGGELFKLYKFRSMYVDADKLGPGVTVSGDKRITPIGKLLRRAKFDELPQFYNVLKGDMSIVGPRPEDPRYVALYTEEQRRILTARPGITGAASLVYHHEEQILSGDDWEQQYITQIMPAKLAIDLEYMERAGWRDDLSIIFRTFLVLPGRSN